MKFEEALKKLELGYTVTRSSMKEDYYFYAHYEAKEVGPHIYETIGPTIGLYRKGGERLWDNYSFSYPEIIAEDWEIKQ